jgi:3-methyladenine DNA glycosylase AlkD
MTEKFDLIMRELKAMEDPSCIAGMARYGIRSEKAYGISITKLMAIRRRVGKSHELAAKLWDTGVHDARLLACLVDDPKLVTEAQMDRWVKDFDTWALCDGCCGHLFDKTPFAYKKAHEWTARKEEYVRRAGFAMIASLTVHDKKADDEVFLKFLPAIRNAATDDRNYVMKAVNWALRQIGKRNARLNKEAINVAEQIHELDSKSAKWIASDALRELKSDPVRARFERMRRKSLH